MTEHAWGSAPSTLEAWGPSGLCVLAISLLASCGAGGSRDPGTERRGPRQICSPGPGAAAPGSGPDGPSWAQTRLSGVLAPPSGGCGPGFPSPAAGPLRPPQVLDPLPQTREQVSSPLQNPTCDSVASLCSPSTWKRGGLSDLTNVPFCLSFCSQLFHGFPVSWKEAHTQAAGLASLASLKPPCASAEPRAACSTRSLPSGLCIGCSLCPEHPSLPLSQPPSYDPFTLWGRCLLLQEVLPDAPGQGHSPEEPLESLLCPHRA